MSSPIHTALRTGINPLTGNRVSGKAGIRNYRPTYDGGQYTGSTGNNKWDDGFHFHGGMNYMDNRGENMGSWSHALRSAASFVPGALAKAGWLMGTTYDYGKLPFSEETFGTVTKSAVTNFFEGLDHTVNEEWLARYGSKDYNYGNFLNRLGTMSFWSKDVTDGAQFLGGAVAYGAVLARTAGAILPALGMGAVGGAGLTATGVAIQKLVGSIAQTLGEAGIEASEIKKEIYEEALQLGKSEQEAELLAAKASERVFKTNAAVLLIPNYINMGWFFKEAKPIHTAVKQAVMSNTAEQAIKKDIAKRFSYKKEILKGMASESFEENAQESVTHLEKMLLHSEADKLFSKDKYGTNADGTISALDYTSLFGSEVARGYRDISVGFFGGTEAGSAEDQRAASMFIGGLLGGLGGARSTYSDRKQANKFYKEYKERWDKFLEIRDLSDRHLIDNRLATLEHMEEEVTDAEGNKKTVRKYMQDNKLMFNKESLLKMQQAGNNKVNRLATAMLASLNENDYALEFIRQMERSAYAYSIASLPNIEQDEVDALIENHLGLPEESEGELAAMGLSKQEIEENKEQIKALAKSLGEIKVELTDISEIDDVNKQEAVNMFTRSAYYLNNRIKGYENMKKIGERIEDPNKQAKFMADMDQLIESDRAMVSDIMNNSKELTDHYVKVVQYGTKLFNEEDAAKQEIANAITNGEDITDMQERSRANNFILGELTKGEGLAFANEKYTGMKRFSNLLPSFEARKGDKSIRGEKEYQLVKDTMTEADLLAQMEMLSRTSKQTGQNPQNTAFESTESSATFSQNVLRKLAEGWIPTQKFVDEFKDRAAADAAVNHSEANERLEILFKLRSALNTMVEVTNAEVNGGQATLDDAIVDNFESYISNDPELLSNLLEVMRGIDIDTESIPDDKLPSDVYNSIGSIINGIDGGKQGGIQNAIQEAEQEIRFTGTTLDALDKAELAAANNNTPNLTVEQFDNSIKEEYFNRHVGNAAQEQVDLYNGNKDNFVSDLDSLINQLIEAKAAYTHRTDISDAFREKMLNKINKLIDELKAANIVAQNNRSKRYAEQRQTEDTYMNEAEKSLQFDGARFNRNNPIVAAIIKVIGDAKFDKWEEYYVNKPKEERTIELVETLISYSAHQKEGNIVSEAIEATTAEVQYQMAKDLMDAGMPPAYTNFLKSFSETTDIGAYFGSPETLLRNFILLITDSIGQGHHVIKKAQTSLNPIQSYNMSRDWIKFKRQVENGELDKFLNDARKEQLKILFESHGKAISLALFRNISQSSIEPKAMVEFFADAYNKEAEKPDTERKMFYTSQQKVIIKQILYQLTSPFINKRFPYILLKGIFGAGKSHVGGKAIVNFLTSKMGVNKSNIHVFAHAAPATRNIAASTGLQPSSPQKFLSTTKESGPHYLIVDEAYVIDNNTLNDLVSHANETGGTIVFMGDPSQTKLEQEPYFDMNSKQGPHTTPLTVVLRTDNPTIVNLSKKFQYKWEKVMDILLFHNAAIADIIAGRTSLKGTLSLPFEKTVEMVMKSQSKDKLIIVNNDSQKGKYMSALQGVDNVKILNYTEAQGSTAQEVYVDLSFNEATSQGSNWRNRMEFNDAVAMAFSRAVDSLVVVENGEFATTNTLNPNMNDTIADISEELDKYRDDLENSVDNYKDTYAILTGEQLNLPKPKPKPAPKPPIQSDPEVNPITEEDVDENGEEILEEDIIDEQEEQEDETTPDKPKDEAKPDTSQEIRLAQPQTKNLPSAKPGTNTNVPAVFAKLYTLDDKKTFWALMGETSADQWQVMAVVSQEDLDNPSFKKAYPKFQEKAKATTPKQDLTSDDISGRTFSYEELAKHVIEDNVTITDAHRVHIRYDKRTATARGKHPKTNFSTILNKIAAAFTDNDTAKEELVKQLQEKSSVEIFTKKDKETLKESITGNIRPGVPYLVFRDIEINDRLMKGISFYITLEPPPISKKSPLMTSLKELRDSAVSLSEALGRDPHEFFNSKQFNNVLDEYAKQFKVIPSTDPNNPKRFDKELKEDAKPVSEILKTVLKMTDRSKDQLDRVQAAMDSLINTGYGIAERSVPMTKQNYAALEQQSPEQFVAFEPIQSKVNLAKPEAEQVGYAFITRANPKTGVTEQTHYKENRLVRNEGVASKSWKTINIANKQINGVSHRLTKTVLRRGEGKTKATAIKALLQDETSYGQMYGPMKDMLRTLSYYLEDIHDDMLTRYGIVHSGPGDYTMSSIPEGMTQEEAQDLLDFVDQLDLRSRLAAGTLKNKTQSFEELEQFFYNYFINPETDKIRGTIAKALEYANTYNVVATNSHARRMLGDRPATAKDFDYARLKKANIVAPIQLQHLNDLVDPEMPLQSDSQYIRQPVQRSNGGEARIHNEPFPLNTPQGQQLFNDTFRTQFSSISPTTVKIAPKKEGQQTPRQEAAPEVKLPQEPEQQAPTVEAPLQTAPTVELPQEPEIVEEVEEIAPDTDFSFEEGTVVAPIEENSDWDLSDPVEEKSAPEIQEPATEETSAEDKLKADLDAGRITLEEYGKELKKICKK